MTTAIEKYILEHIDNEDELLAELNRQTHLKVLMPRMLSGHLQGKVLEMLSKMIQPQYILEIGTFTGYSAICLSKGLRENGLLHTIEIDDELETFIRKYLEKGNFQQKITLHIGNALHIIPNFEIQFDLIFIDGDKRQYIDYYDCAFKKLKIGGYIIADNVLWSGKVAEPLAANDYYTKGIMDFNDFVSRDQRVEKVIFPIRDGFTVIRKLTE